MTIASKALIAGTELTAITSTLYTSTSVQTVISQFTATNYSGTDRTMTIYAVPNGASAADRYVIAEDFTVPANKSKRVPTAEGLVMEASGTLQGIASSASAITITASGTIIT